MNRSAIISRCGRYRYRLDRWWDDAVVVDEYGTPAAGLSPLVFIMLNPSTADADVDDATIRRCVGFARREGANGITVVNLYAWRATDPRELAKVTNPTEGLQDVADAAICAALCNDGALPVIVAWGAAPPCFTRRDSYHWYRVRDVLDIIHDCGRPMRCLGTTKDGHPKHPLYLASVASIEPYAPPAWLYPWKNDPTITGISP